MQVLIIGCGGTGSALIKEFARYLSNKKHNNDVSVTLIDGDIIEAKKILIVKLLQLVILITIRPKPWPLQ